MTHGQRALWDFPVSVPINISDTDEVESVDLVIAYDTVLLDTTAGQVATGNIWPGSATIVAKVDDAVGTIIQRESSGSRLRKFGRY